jgi:hypothetical protein
VKFSSYFPYAGRLILNGNEYARRQAAKAGTGFTPLDNAFAAVDDVAAVQNTTATMPGVRQRARQEELVLQPARQTTPRTPAGHPAPP